jgi:hypothetical protein
LIIFRYFLCKLPFPVAFIARWWNMPDCYGSACEEVRIKKTKCCVTCKCLMDSQITVERQSNDLARKMHVTRFCGKIFSTNTLMMNLCCNIYIEGSNCVWSNDLSEGESYWTVRRFSFREIMSSIVWKRYRFAKLMMRLKQSFTSIGLILQLIGQSIGVVDSFSVCL